MARYNIPVASPSVIDVAHYTIDEGRVTLVATGDASPAAVAPLLGYFDGAIIVLRDGVEDANHSTVEPIETFVEITDNGIHYEDDEGNRSDEVPWSDVLLLALPR